MSDSLLKNVSDTPGGPIYRINFSDDESLIHDNKNSSSRANIFARAWRSVIETVKCATRRGTYTQASQLPTTSTNTAASSSGGDGKEAADYQELCRQRAKGSGGNTKGNVSPTVVNEKPDSPRSSTSSWSEEPIKSQNIDITTGHSILVSRHVIVDLILIV